MKKILLLFTGFLLLISGILLYHYFIYENNTQYGYKNIHTNKIQTQYIKSEIDSLSRIDFNKKCTLDSIPTDLSYWYKSSWKDAETNKEYVSWIYINNYKTYKLTLITNNIDTLFILETRILYNIK